MPTHVNSSLAAAALALAAPVSAQAQDQSGDWRFRVAPYLLAPVMNGDVVVHGAEAEADLGPDDIFSNLNFGFQGWLEARTDSWGVALDVIYMDLDATDDDRVLELDVSQAAVTAIAFARVTPTIDLYTGARYNDLGGDIDFQGPLNLPTLAQDRDWIDPLVGLRFTTPLGGKWNFQVAADVGGFGIGSDLAVNAWPMVGYELSSSAQIAFGYRMLYTDYDHGTGADRFEYDVLTHGPVIGAVFDF